ncbi:MAG TPA: hypothetical protein VHX13_06475 [Acidobacteriaceae bacterium]|jgi:hypothetical protein|nr:hypothetical protein [Acidobacteriaceae bacterium]
MFLERDGLPFTARIAWGWYLALIALSFGWAAAALGLWLGLWIHSKRKRGIAVYVFAVIVVVVLIAVIPDRMLPVALPWDGIITAVAVLWYIGTFALRHEILKFYAESQQSSPRISIIWTALFSVAYLNWCLSLTSPDTIFSAGETGVPS